MKTEEQIKPEKASFKDKFQFWSLSLFAPVITLSLGFIVELFFQDIFGVFFGRSIQIPTGIILWLLFVDRIRFEVFNHPMRSTLIWGGVVKDFFKKRIKRIFTIFMWTFSIMKDKTQSTARWIRTRSRRITTMGVIALTSALFVLVIANPSPSSFESFVKSKIDPNQIKYVAYGRVKNYFIYSIYEINSTRMTKDYIKDEFGFESLRFKGIFGNFKPL